MGASPAAAARASCDVTVAHEAFVAVITCAGEQGPPFDFLQRDLAGLAEVLLEGVVELLDEGGVEDGDRDLEVDDEGAVVEVGRSDDRPLPVDRDRLHVHHGGLVLVDPDSGLEKPRIPRLAGVANQPGVLVPVGNQEPHVESTPRGVLQADLEIWIRDEVRRRDIDALTGPVEHEPVREADLRSRTDGPGVDHRHLLVAGRSDLREYLAPAQDFPGGLTPVLRERSLQVPHHRTLEPEVIVPPVGSVTGIARPFTGDPNTAREPESTIDDHDLAMRSMVETPQPVPPNRIEPRHLGPCVSHLVDQIPVHDVRADRVEYDSDRHAATGRGG